MIPCAIHLYSVLYKISLTRSMFGQTLWDQVVQKIFDFITDTFWMEILSLFWLIGFYFFALCRYHVRDLMHSMCFRRKRPTSQSKAASVSKRHAPNRGRPAGCGQRPLQLRSFLRPRNAAGHQDFPNHHKRWDPFNVGGDQWSLNTLLLDHYKNSFWFVSENLSWWIYPNIVKPSE